MDATWVWLFWSELPAGERRAGVRSSARTPPAPPCSRRAAAGSGGRAGNRHDVTS